MDYFFQIQYIIQNIHTILQIRCIETGWQALRNSSLKGINYVI